MLDIDAKIQELKEKLSKVKNDRQSNELLKTEPSWFQMFREFYIESQLKQLEAIKNKKFHVNIKMKIDCETFGSKEFPLVEFDLEDDDTIKHAIQNYMKQESSKNSLFE